MGDETVSFTVREALHYHEADRPGKIEIVASKPMATQRDLSLAYSPGVAEPVKAIAEDPANAARYTARSNLVAVISNGSAILGLGNLGALASKPVMEGKAVLFKRFADVDAIDLELDTEDPDAFIAAVSLMEPSFGGINLEDIKAPECFIIEQALRDKLAIPIMHDDQHGTAIISAAGLLNACHITGRDLAEVKVVVNGAGAAAIACTALMKAMGVRHENVIMCDRTGPITPDREGVDQWKSAQRGRDRRHPRSKQALVGADIFLGLSAAGALKPEWIIGMADQPIIFAMANPVPEIMPDDARGRPARRDHRHRPIGLSQPGQQRARLPVHLPRRARRARDRDQRGDEDRRRPRNRRAGVRAGARGGGGGLRHPTTQFGRDYIIPVPFDPRLMEVVSSAVAKAAMESGVAQSPIEDFDHYRQALKGRLNPTTSVLTTVYAEGKEQSQARDLRRGGGGSRAARGDPVPAISATARRCWSAGPRRWRRGCVRWARPIPTVSRSRTRRSPSMSARW